VFLAAHDVITALREIDGQVVAGRG